MPKNKISPAEKLAAAKHFLNGEGSQRSIADHIGIRHQSFQQWIRNYKSMGRDTFIMVGNKKYSSELKLSAVQDYLVGIEMEAIIQ